MPTAPTIGALRERVEVQKPVDGRTETGQAVLTWQSKGFFWAQVEYARTGSGENVETDQEIATNRVNFRFRSFVKVHERDRLLYKGRYYDVLIVREFPPHFIEVVAAYQG